MITFGRCPKYLKMPEKPFLSWYVSNLDLNHTDVLTHMIRPPRTGGFHRSYTLGGHARSMRTTASIEYLSAGLRLALECTSLCTRK